MSLLIKRFGIIYDIPLNASKFPTKKNISDVFIFQIIKSSINIYKVATPNQHFKINNILHKNTYCYGMKKQGGIKGRREYQEWQLQT